jgi:transposase
MSKRRFTNEQIEALLQNENVLHCSEKAITYRGGFKIKAVKEYQEEHLTPKEIFRKYGFDLETIGQSIPAKCLEHWNNIYRTRGMEKLGSESRGRLGGRHKMKELSDKDRIKKLETQIAYYKAENHFLIGLRAKRAE